MKTAALVRISEPASTRLATSENVESSVNLTVTNRFSERTKPAGDRNGSSGSVLATTGVLR